MAPKHCKRQALRRDNSQEFETHHSIKSGIAIKGAKGTGRPPAKNSTIVA